MSRKMLYPAKASTATSATAMRRRRLTVDRSATEHLIPLVEHDGLSRRHRTRGPFEVEHEPVSRRAEPRRNLLAAIAHDGTDDGSVRRHVAEETWTRRRELVGAESIRVTDHQHIPLG